MLYEQEVKSLPIPNNPCSSLYQIGVNRHASPPWTGDDKDGHYMFALGENLTPRCNMTLAFILFA